MATATVHRSKKLRPPGASPCISEAPAKTTRSFSVHLHRAWNITGSRSAKDRRSTTIASFSRAEACERLNLAECHA